MGSSKPEAPPEPSPENELTMLGDGRVGFQGKGRVGFQGKGNALNGGSQGSGDPCGGAVITVVAAVAA